MTSQVSINNVVDQISPKLHGFALKLTKNSDDAQDLYQDTIFKIITNISKFKVGTNFKAWSYTIMRNIFINSYRKKQRMGTILDNTKESFYINSSAGLVSNEGEMNMSMEEIQGEIEKLKEEIRTPFMMNFYGYKYDEIAEHLDIPLGTVKSRIFIARKRLQEALAEKRS